MHRANRAEHRTLGVGALALLDCERILCGAARADDRTETRVPAVWLAVNRQETVVPWKVDAFQIAWRIHANKERALFRQVFCDTVQLTTVEVFAIAVHRHIGEQLHVAWAVARVAQTHVPNFYRILTRRHVDAPNRFDAIRHIFDHLIIQAGTAFIALVILIDRRETDREILTAVRVTHINNAVILNDLTVTTGRRHMLSHPAVALVKHRQIVRVINHIVHRPIRFRSRDAQFFAVRFIFERDLFCRPTKLGRNDFC